ncbi:MULTISPECIES: peptidylprolyl isomerase [Galbibacter]|uniref:peptidylprolyl isomerase n=1 Tax=Galbibacter pacificus TaxID=2996052 RepID=A0ABT6FNY4_9FLAO|nr:peptidylprolyl isomerase [Galbibacter pacificus]MDG3581333.1 peptidylprolyl isomerase [Galbibacter pacificus]MDG3584811.1 peptidylprolyl isomerase [Galbibacter pacificus]
MKKLSFIFILAIVLTSCSSSKYSDLGDGLYADIQTTKGDMIVKLFYNQTPITVANFVSLAEGTNTYVSDTLKGKLYYDGVTFHRVIKDFMIQTGDPTGTGSGNPGYKFKNEIVDSLKHDKKGMVSMANAGPDTNGSQFFITHKATPFLDGKYSIFGEVVAGLGVIDSIANVETSQDPANKDRPIDTVKVNHVQIVRVGKEAKSFDASKVFEDYFAEEAERQKAIEDAKKEIASEFEAQKEEAQSSESGLHYIYIKEGTGEKPKVGQTALIDYAGYFENGNVFDTSILDIAEKFGNVNPGKLDRGLYKPAPMVISPDATLIPGFKEGIMMMKVGDKLRLFIPSYLAYGDSGYGPIPPKTDLVFDLEMTGIQE